MNVKTLALTLVALGLLFPALKAQKDVEISAPSLSLKDEKVQIEYQILHAAPEETFTIRIEVRTESGKTLNAKTLSGDIGPGISAKGKLTILWDINADGIFLDEEVFIEVFARSETPAKTEEPVVTEETAVIEEPSASKESPGRHLSRTGLIIQSVAFPGLGLSRLNPGQPHWLRGVAAYGCLGASIYLNRSAWNNYQEYLDPPALEDVQDLFDKAHDQQKLSRTLGYAALGIWLVDLTWTIIGTSGMDQNLSSANARGLSIGSRLDPVSNAPMLALNYRF